MIWETLSAARDLGRVHAIASVLVRYGFSDMVNRLGMSGFLEKAGRVLNWKRLERVGTLTPAERLREALEELGPTFVKLGQVLATRIDLLPPDWVTAFEALQDRVPFVPYEQLLPVLTKELGAAPETIFREIDPEPLAAASLAQVHRARLADGTDVVLKIRRPGVAETVEADLRLLERLAEIVASELPELRRYRPREVVRQFARTMRNEIDFSRECRNAERVQRSFGDVEYLVVPQVYWDWTTPQLNVQARIDGIPVRDLQAVTAAGLDRKLIARRGAEVILRMILEDGFFHADPHPGNIFCLPENRLALIDFGMVGRMTEPRRHEVVRLLFALAEQDSRGVVDILLDWTDDHPVDAELLTGDVEEFVDTYHDLTLAQLDLGAMLGDMLRVVREHQIRLPQGLSLLFRALIMVEGIGRRLDPEFSVVDTARPFLRRAVRRRYRPRALARRARHNLTETVDLLIGMPRDLRRLIRSARRGSIRLNLDLSRLDHFGHQLDRAASRITVGMILGSIIIGTAIVMTLADKAKLFGVPLLGVVGFLTAIISGVWILASIRRGSRDRGD